MRTRIVLVSMAALFAAMLGRAGFVDLPQVLGIGITVLALAIAVLLVLAIVIGVPVGALYALINLVDWAISAKHQSTASSPPQSR